MIGHELEKSGWRQGSIVKDEDLAQLFGDELSDFGEGVVAIVATQSCDIANNNLDVDPNIEVSIARIIDNKNGNYENNKNPRILHLDVSLLKQDEEGLDTAYLELKAYEKIAFDKRAFEGISPDPHRNILKQQHDYVSWLAARYARPALPTEFNDLIERADPKNKRKKIVKKLNDLSGIYVHINPDREIEPGEKYKVQLMGVLPDDYDGDITVLTKSLNEVGKIMEEGGMDVSSAVTLESKVSIAMIKRFKRFYFDDLSIKDDKPRPVETGTIL